MLEAFNKLVMGIIIVVAAIAFVTLCFGLVVKRKENLFLESQPFFQGYMRRRRAAIRRANRRLGPEAQDQGQGIPVVQLVQIQPNQNNAKSAVKPLSF